MLAATLQAACLTVQAQQPEIDAGSAINVAPNINTDVMGQPLSHLVNSPYKELGPMPTKDGTRLYFSRQGYPENTGGAHDEDIWYCEFNEATQSWTDAINIGPPLNNEGPNFVTGVGVNGDTLLLGNEYGKRGKMKSGLSITIRVGTQWTFPVPVRISNDYNFSSRAGYDLSADRTALIIAQEKLDSRGKLDLYVAFRDPDANYPYSGRESVNLGPVINSFGNETSPWLAYDNRTLYFSSDGRNGYGGLDIYMSKRLDHTWTNWSEPVNLGPGINSIYDDMSFNYNAKSRYAYFARGLSPDNSDIYRIDMTYLFKESAKPAQNLLTNEAVIEIGQTEVVNYVFDDESSEINPETKGAIDAVIAEMKKYPKMVILIGTHSNLHEDRSASLTLSNQRAQKIFDYFIKNGIAENRLSYTGYGHDILVNAKPDSRHPASNIAGMVEFKLIGLNPAIN